MNAPMNAPPITSLDGFGVVELTGFVSVAASTASDGVGGARRANLRGDTVTNTRENGLASPVV